MLSAGADDDYATIVRFLGEHDHYTISPDDVAKVQAFMKANGYQHVSEIPKSVAAVFDSPSAQPTAAPIAPGDFPPVAVHVGDTVADALAYSKQLIPFLKAHAIPGRVQEEKSLALFRLILKAAQDTGNQSNLEYFTKIVMREVESAGMVDAYGNQPGHP